MVIKECTTLGDYLDYLNDGVINLNEYVRMKHGVPYDEPSGVIQPIIDYAFFEAFMIINIDNIWLSQSVGIENIIYPLVGLGLDVVKNRGIDGLIVFADSLSANITSYWDSLRINN